MERILLEKKAELEKKLASLSVDNLLYEIELKVSAYREKVIKEAEAEIFEEKKSITAQIQLIEEVFYEADQREAEEDAEVQDSEQEEVEFE